MALQTCQIRGPQLLRCSIRSSLQYANQFSSKDRPDDLGKSETSTPTQEASQSGSEASTSAPSSQEVIQQIKSLPGYLKGPVGRRVVRALGQEEWVEAVDPKTGQPCWKNIKSGELTVPGTAKPETWEEAVDKQTGLIYYWCRKTGETTAIGEPKPGPYGRHAHAQSAAAALTQPQKPKALDTTDVFSMVGSKAGNKDEAQDTSIAGLLKSPLGVMFAGLCVISGVSIVVRTFL